jgi:hypothetical protein
VPSMPRVHTLAHQLGCRCALATHALALSHACMSCAVLQASWTSSWTASQMLRVRVPGRPDKHSLCHNVSAFEFDYARRRFCIMCSGEASVISQPAKGCSVDCAAHTDAVYMASRLLLCLCNILQTTIAAGFVASRKCLFPAEHLWLPMRHGEQ